MLTQITRKLCPFVSLAIAAVGCGKKINEASSEPSSTTDHQEPSSVMVLQLEGLEKTYDILQNGVMSLPEKLFVRRGTGAGKRVVITYNLEEGEYGEDGTHVFKCDYFSATDPSEIHLEKCYDIGGPFGDISGHFFPVYYGKKIRLEFANGNSDDTVIESIYSVDWK